MSIALIFLAVVVLGALLIREKAHDRDRRELLSSHQNELVRLERSHRLDMDAAARERADLLERLHTTAADQVAAVVRTIPRPETPAPAVPDFVFPIDEDLRLLEPAE